MGICFVFLAKRYQKNNVIYFCLGFVISLLVRIIYLVLYGLVTDFKVDQNFDYHRNLSIVLSIIISIICFRLMKMFLEKKSKANLEIDEIGEQ